MKLLRRRLVVLAGLLMQGVIDNPAPGPRMLNHPATPQGTLNEATPPLDYYAFLGATRLPYGAPLNPVKSISRRIRTVIRS